MRKALKTDKKNIVEIIAESFDENPSVNWTVKQDKKRVKRYKRLAGLVFNRAFRRDAIYISSDNNGVIIFYKFCDFKDRMLDIIEKAIMAFTVIGIFRAGEILNRESYIERQRPQDGKFIYVWFYGVRKSARGTGSQSASVELKNHIFETAGKMKIPVLLETTIPINMKIYSRYGFHIYHEWNVKEKGLTYWMMRRNF